MAKSQKRSARIERRFYLTFKDRLVWMISTAFAIAAALMWKDAITLMINNYISITGEIQYSIYAASIVTIVGIAIIWGLNEIFKK